MILYLYFKILYKLAILLDFFFSYPQNMAKMQERQYNNNNILLVKNII